ncbi:MAG: hypothetical protein M3385_04825 [Actinomycetota bacterium]|nr:hypothetical protein [Actinomycetota bacterium]
MKRMIKVLVVAALIAVILVASISPAMARRGNFGHRMPTDTPCNVGKAENESGAHHDIGPGGHEGCWVVVPGLNK